MIRRDATAFRVEPGGASRFHSNPGKPVLVYLPGVHGDWTLFTSFRVKAVKEFQVLEFTYPRTIDWSLDEYARFVETELDRHGIRSGWILAESYSSQVAWALVERTKLSSFTIEGIVLAGGFVQYPLPVFLKAAKLWFAVLPSPCWKGVFWMYGQYAKFRHRKAPETKAAVEEFIQRRTPADLMTVRHRFDLIGANDPCQVVEKVNCPVFLLAGSFDPIVFTRPVLRWLQRNCPRFSGYRIIWPADHNVLGTEPEKALRQIQAWVRTAETKEIPSAPIV